jgi:hypothetical protein
MLGASTALVLSACGSSSSGGRATSVLAPSTVAAPATTLPASGPQSAFCVQVHNLKTGYNPYNQVAIGGEPKVFELHFVGSATMFGMLNAAAPSSLRADFDELKQDILVFAKDADRLGWDVTKIAADPIAAAEIADPKVRAAFDHIRSVIESECGTGSGPSGSSANLPN